MLNGGAYFETNADMIIYPRIGVNGSILFKYLLSILVSINTNKMAVLCMHIIIISSDVKFICDKGSLFIITANGFNCCRHRFTV